MGRWCWVLLACVARVAAAGWELRPLDAATQPVELTGSGLTVGPLTFARADDEALSASATVTAAPGSAGSETLALALFDEERQPLVGASEPLVWCPARSPFVEVAAAWQVRWQCGPQPRAKFCAVGLVEQPRRRHNLLLESAGARVRDASSTFGPNYLPEFTIQADPDRRWSSDTGATREQWLLYELPGTQPLRLAGVGLNPSAEPAFPDAALRAFSVWVSASGAGPDDFKCVLRANCEARNELQPFSFPPVDAHFVRLVCHTNHGHTEWLELSRFEAYPPSDGGPSPLMTELVDLSQPGPRDSDGRGCRQVTAIVPADGGLVRLAYEFGNLLGGAPQTAALAVERTLPPRAGRLQFRVRGDRPGNALRAVLADADGDRWTVELGRLESRAWRSVSCDLVPRLAGKQARYPLRLVRLAVAPKSREGLSGWVEFGEVVALSAP